MHRKEENEEKYRNMKAWSYRGQETADLEKFVPISALLQCLVKVYNVVLLGNYQWRTDVLVCQSLNCLWSCLYCLHTAVSNTLVVGHLSDDGHLLETLSAMLA